MHDAMLGIKAFGNAYLSAMAPMEPFWYSSGASASSDGIMDATCRRQNRTSCSVRSGSLKGTLSPADHW